MCAYESKCSLMYYQSDRLFQKHSKEIIWLPYQILTKKAHCVTEVTSETLIKQRLSQMDFQDTSCGPRDCLNQASLLRYCVFY